MPRSATSVDATFVDFESLIHVHAVERRRPARSGAPAPRTSRRPRRSASTLRGRVRCPRSASITASAAASAFATLWSPSSGSSIALDQRLRRAPRAARSRDRNTRRVRCAIENRRCSPATRCVIACDGDRRRVRHPVSTPRSRSGTAAPCRRSTPRRSCIGRDDCADRLVSTPDRAGRCSACRAAGTTTPRAPPNPAASATARARERRADVAGRRRSQPEALEQVAR